ncbi:MAG: DUF819 family protein [Phycisphaerales bacterium]|nr:DUF819 family protein [Phycisphaerales bacterium]MCB9862278.1 DUF819 family protein [Phycisphaerales bacterium]
MRSALYFQILLASSPNESILINDIPGVITVVLVIPAIIFFAAGRPKIGCIFKIVPGLVFCYFLPTLLSTPWEYTNAAGDAAIFRVIPNASPVYQFVKGPVLLASLFLLTLNLDLPGIIRLGPKAIGMLLAGSIGVIVGGPIAVWLWQSYLPADGHLPLAYLAGSWIGGGPNAIALQKSFGVSDAAISPVIVVDAFISNMWLAVLLMMAARSSWIDKRLGGDTTAIDTLVKRIEDYHDEVGRQASIADIVTILALGFGVSWLSVVTVDWLMAHTALDATRDVVSPFAWKVLVATLLGIGASLTRMRSLEGAGASRFGGVMIYVLVACIGAGADFSRLNGAGGYMLIAATWMLIHIVVLLGAAIAMKAPLFYVATGSQANIGGPASAPIVAGAFHPALAPVGALLAIAGYAIGTLGGLACVHLMNMMVR